MPQTTSPFLGFFLAKSRSPSLWESSLYSAAAVSAFAPPAMTYCTVAGGRLKVGLLAVIGHDLAFFVGADQVHAVRGDYISDGSDRLFLLAVIEVVHDALPGKQRVTVEPCAGVEITVAPVVNL